MKVFVLIFNKPLRVEVYSSLSAVFEAHGADELGISRSTLDKWDFAFKYVNSKIVLSKNYTQTAGDVRRKKSK